MTEERWDEIKNTIKKNYQLLEEKKEPILIKKDLEGERLEEIGNKEILIFVNPLGKMKLEYIVKPVVLERKEHYSHRQGDSSQTEYIYSDTEFTRRIQAFRWIDVDNDWQPIDSNSFS